MFFHHHFHKLGANQQVLRKRLEEQSDAVMMAYLQPDFFSGEGFELHGDVDLVKDLHLVGKLAEERRRSCLRHHHRRVVGVALSEKIHHEFSEDHK